MKWSLKGVYSYSYSFSPQNTVIDFMAIDGIYVKRVKRKSKDFHSTIAFNFVVSTVH